MTESTLNLAQFVRSLIDAGDEKETIPGIPPSPTEIFLIMASLLEKAGAYPHFEPAFQNIGESNCEHYPPRFGISKSARDSAVDIGAEWKQLDDKPAPDRIVQLWHKLFESHGESPLRERADFTTAPEWWSKALFLLIASDEASENIGVSQPDEEASPMYIEAIHQYVFDKVRRDRSDVASTPDGYKVANGSAASFAVNGIKETANVFPKLNISSRGISHRNFTKNLTLLPGTGTVRCHWHAPQRPLKKEDSKPMNVLLVPFPYEMSAKAFKEAGKHHSATAALDTNTDRNWANFIVDQSEYDPHDLVKLCNDLVNSAEKDGSTVNGVIFPELAIDFYTFSEICKNLRAKNQDLEFLIAGSSDNCQGFNGNYVLTAIWSDELKSSVTNKDSDAPVYAVLSSRRKHHRWMLNKTQIEEYGLASVLDPRLDWWEEFVGGFRELHFYPIRESSVMSSLICEDLARADPCHEVLKSVGPNFVVSLLMDGTQIESRWPARYAKSLSEDIATSVLTITSYALVNRVNQSGKFKESNVIGYFASPFGSEEISLPYSSGARGVLLCLSSEKMGDQCTVDGRQKRHRVWKLASNRPVYI